jgi:hypothetical protein
MGLVGGCCRAPFAACPVDPQDAFSSTASCLRPLGIAHDQRQGAAATVRAQSDCTWDPPRAAQRTSPAPPPPGERAGAATLSRPGVRRLPPCLMWVQEAELFERRRRGDGSTRWWSPLHVPVGAARDGCGLYLLSWPRVSSTTDHSRLHASPVRTAQAGLLLPVLPRRRAPAQSVAGVRRRVRPLTSSAWSDPPTILCRPAKCSGGLAWPRVDLGVLSGEVVDG